MENKEIRRARLEALILEHGSAAELERITGTDATYIRNIKNGVRQMGDELARRFEEKLEKPRGWMDTPEGSGLMTRTEDERDMLEKYRKASPRWRLSLRYLAEVPDDEQNEVSESVNVLMAKIFAKPVSDEKVEKAYGRPPSSRVFSTRARTTRNKSEKKDSGSKRG